MICSFIKFKIFLFIILLKEKSRNQIYEKLKNIRFHTLEIDPSKIDSLIMAFESFEDNDSKLDPINSDSWIRLSLKSSFCDTKSTFEKFEVKSIAQMCARFPSLRELEIYYNNSLYENTFNLFLLEEQKEYNTYLKQIKTLWAKLNKNLSNNESFICIEKSNITFGVLIGERIASCKANKVYIKWLIRWCELVDSSLNQNQHYLIIKNESVEFSFEDLELDKLCTQDQAIYDKLLKKHIMQNKKFFLNEPSILFIVPIEHIAIPNKVIYTPIIINIALNDFRQLYSLTFSQTEISTEVEEYINSLNDQIRFEVKIIESVVYLDNTFEKLILNKRYQKRSKGGAEDKKQLLKRIWEKLLSKNIFSLKINKNFYDEWLVDLLVEYWNKNTQLAKSRLHDIELKLTNPNDAKRILEALHQNFMTKTIKLETEDIVDLET